MHSEHIALVLVKKSCKISKFAGSLNYRSKLALFINSCADLGGGGGRELGAKKTQNTSYVLISDIEYVTIHLQKNPPILKTSRSFDIMPKIVHVYSYFKFHLE